ncbi:urea ABC transporter ATP-binding protein UrtD [Calderihabitans maritimus]|uniref:Urea ABC transporter ATP-binding protein UrtD n=1 Tax=Calderihabitans maritimus TaxID=1246530 RepID=A0A1Z5HTD6_9FIRM|nr:urea ABC transporter ATP-binding protein UrtD [Calderihabitans maritimus]GAW92792.1 urea ABC transporter ATP-binding protein UrtD [Calderihabitans maritimus]
MAGTVIYVENLTVSFNGFKALNQMNFCMRYGELHFLIGPNGAGKTTLLDVICGKLKPTRGRVIFKEEVDIGKRQEHDLVNLGISRKFQTPSVFTDLTVYENLDLALRRKRGILSALFHKTTPAEEERIIATLENIRLTDKIHVKAGLLSHGEKQRLEIGMLLVQDPELLLLDEPVAGLTKSERQKIGELLQSISQRCSVLVVEHDMGFVRQFAQRVTVMHEGKVLSEGNVARIQSDPKVIEVYLGRGGDNSC